MAANTDVKALQDQNKQISYEADTLKDRKVELETEIAARREAIPHENREIPLLRLRASELETEIDTQRTEVERLNYFVGVAEQALQVAKDTAKRSVLVDMGLSFADDNSGNHHYTQRCSRIDAMTDIQAINSIAETNFGGLGKRSGHQATILKPRMRGANTL